MSLTEARIRECASDDELFELLSFELQSRLPDGEGENLDTFVERLRLLPVGLQAMAAIYQLDVSITLDDLGWHFANWHHRSYCDKTLWALDRYVILGVTTNIDLLRAVIAHPEFAAGRLHTHFLETHDVLSSVPSALRDEALIVAALASQNGRPNPARSSDRARFPIAGPWQSGGVWRAY